ncbi:MAG: hypothetical protein ACRD1T_11485, partial [Acidimicrobiia bacterium]
ELPMNVPRASAIALQTGRAVRLALVKPVRAKVQPAWSRADVDRFDPPTTNQTSGRLPNLVGTFVHPRGDRYQYDVSFGD